MSSICDIPDKRHCHRIAALDFIKGLCMILVVFDHVQIVDVASCRIYQMLDAIEVPAFFMVSGYLFRYSEDEGWNHWFLHKVRRLVIPFLFFGLIYAAADFMTHPAGVMSQWKSYLFNIYMKPVNYPMWFVRSLLYILLIYSVLYRHRGGVESRVAGHGYGDSHGGDICIGKIDAVEG